MVGATVHSKDGKSFKKNDVVSQIETGNSHEFIDGKTLNRYEVRWDGRYIDYRRDEMYGPIYPELFESEKVLLRKRTGEDEKLISCYDPDKYYCDDTVLAITYYDNLQGTGAQLIFEGYDRIALPYPSILYTLGILNSSLITYIFKLIHATGTLQGSYSDVYPQQVRDFPIRKISFSTPKSEYARLVADLQELAMKTSKKGRFAALSALQVFIFPHFISRIDNGFDHVI